MVKFTKKNLRKWMIFVLLIPFFELQSFTMLVEYNYYPTLFNAILDLYSALRLLITLGMLIYIFQQKKIQKSGITFAVLFLIVLENIASIINESIYINFTIGSLAFLGLALLSQEASQKYQEDFIFACKHLFGLLSVAGALQIILMPHGFLNHNDKAYAVYLLGAKNTSFFFYIVFLFFLFYDDLIRFMVIRKRSLVYLALFMLAAIRCDSMNTLMMLLILFIFVVIVNYGKILRKFITPPIVWLCIIIGAIIILLPNARGVLAPALNMIGRDTSFTGRDVLWVQAINDFRQRPFFGNGISTEFCLETGIWQDNAHSQCLDLLAKYGIFVFLAYISMPIIALNGAFKKDKKHVKIFALKCSICFILLFHSLIDHMMMCQFILLMSAIELLTAPNTPLKEQNINVIEE